MFYIGLAKLNIRLEIVKVKIIQSFFNAPGLHTHTHTHTQVTMLDDVYGNELDCDNYFTLFTCD